MPELLMLVGDAARARNDNHQRLPAAFRAAGWTVLLADHDALEIHRNRLVIDGSRPLTGFDLIWPLGFGRAATFFDRMQLLAGLDGARFVTSPQVLLTLHGKHRWLEHMPETHTSAHPERLIAVLDSGGDWVLKPTAGSYGRNVLLIREGEASLELIEELSHEEDGGYLMAQRFVPAVASGEKRTLVAGGEIIGTYLRLPVEGHRSNLAQGGEPRRACLAAEERALVQEIGRALAGLGAGFAAVDTVYPYLMEVNVANPGGLATLAELDGRDLTGEAVNAILSWQGFG